MSNDNAARHGALSLRRKSALLGSICGFGLATGLTLACLSTPAAARSYGYSYSYGYAPSFRHKAAHKEHREKEADHAGKEPFGTIPKGPLEIFVSIDQQKLHLYSDGVHVADTSVATGVPGLPTPLGVFSVIQKQVFHRSNIYSGAPMPFMQRITWSGVAMHEGESIGHRASHGCIRMPGDFARRLYSLTKLGVRVIVANGELKPTDFADPHLFVHKDKPADQAAAVPADAQPVKTAQSVDSSKSVDAPSAGAAAASTDLGLRGGNNTAAASASADPKSAPVASAAPKSDPPPPEAQAAADAATPAAGSSASSAAATAGNPPAVAGPDDSVPMPLGKPATLVRDAPEKNTPVSVFISRKENKLYVRQNFQALFEAGVTIDHPAQPLGTHVFTALGFLGDDHTAFRWNVVTLPAESPPRSARHSEDESRYDRHAGRHRRDEDGAKPVAAMPPPQTPSEALARIAIPQDVIDHISEMMVPGSSLIVSDHGLGDETGEGTDFIVVMR